MRRQLAEPCPKTGVVETVQGAPNGRLGDAPRSADILCLEVELRPWFGAADLFALGAALLPAIQSAPSMRRSRVTSLGVPADGGTSSSSEADRLLVEIGRCPLQLSYVRVSNLFAAKRPVLVPIRDSVVEKFFGATEELVASIPRVGHARRRRRLFGLSPTVPSLGAGTQTVGARRPVASGPPRWSSIGTRTPTSLHRRPAPAALGNQRCDSPRCRR